MLQGWKAIHEHVCAYVGRDFSADTVRKWKWLTPALEDFNGRVGAPIEQLEQLLAARKKPRTA